jgi:hypothetical protein
MARRRKSLKTISGPISRPGVLTAKKHKGESTTLAAQRISKSPSTSVRSKQESNFFLNVLHPVGAGAGARKSASNSKRRSHTVKSHKRVLPSGKSVRVKRHRRSKAKS